MNKVEQVEQEVEQFNSEELKSFRDWFARFDADAWDQQFEADASSGKLDSAAERALRDYRAGRATRL